MPIVRTEEIMVSSNQLTNTINSTSKGLTFNQLQTVFPFHIRINSSFIITQVGKRLAKLFPLNGETNEPVCIGEHIDNVFTASSPSRLIWDYKRLKMSQHMTFSFDLKETEKMSRTKLPLIGGVIISNPNDDPSCNEVSAMFLLNLRIKYTDELHDLGLGWSDTTPYGFQKELVLTSEHLKAEISLRQNLEKLKSSLEEEKSKTMVNNISMYIINMIKYKIKPYIIILGATRNKKILCALRIT